MVRLEKDLEIEILPIIHKNGKSDYLFEIVAFSSDPLGARTQDPNIKSVVLYLLS